MAALRFISGDKRVFGFYEREEKKSRNNLLGA